MSKDKKILIFLAIGAVILWIWLINDYDELSGKASYYNPPGEGWVLAWSDEFSGKNIDTNVWTHEVGDGCPNLCGWGNNEYQSYSDSKENSYIENGNLVIKAIHTNKNSYSNRGNYSSARLKSQGKFAFKYGLVVARMRAPQGKGIWPAIWMLGENITTVGWPKCGEIDIFEMFGGQGGESSYSQLGGAMHFWEDSAEGEWKWKYTTGKTNHSKNLSESFHNYSLEWNEKQLTWRFDGTPFFSQSVTNDNRKEFRATNFFLLMNIAVGGNTVPDPDDTTLFPQTMAIDWIRVYTNMNQLDGSIAIRGDEAGSKSQ